MITTHSSKKKVLAAVKINGFDLALAHEDLKNDLEVVLAAVKQNPGSFNFAHDDLKKNKKIVLAIVRLAGSALLFVHEDLKNNKEVVLAAVTQNGNAFYYASENLKKDKEVVLAAINQNPYTLQFADYSLRKNKEVILAAVRKSGDVITFAASSMKNDRTVMLAAVKNSHLAFQHASANLKRDKEILLYEITRTTAITSYKPYFQQDWIPFFEALVLLNQLLIKMEQSEYKEKITRVLSHCKYLFLREESDITELTNVLTKTQQLISKTISSDNYKCYAKQIATHKSRVVLGSLMIALATATLGLSIIAVCSGFAIVPAAVIATCTFGLFAAGLAVSNIQRKDTKVLSTRMNELSSGLGQVVPT